MPSPVLDRPVPRSTVAPPSVEARRDTAWFSDFYAATFDNAYRFAISLTRNPDVSEDIVADAYVKAWRARAQHREDASALSWILSITRNCAMDALAVRRPLVHLDPANEPEDPADDLFRRELTPAELQALHDALKGLTPDQRQVVQLRFYEGLSHEDVAKRLGKEANAVRALQFRALARLRKSLEAAGVH